MLHEERKGSPRSRKLVGRGLKTADKESGEEKFRIGEARCLSKDNLRKIKRKPHETLKEGDRSYSVNG